MFAEPVVRLSPRRRLRQNPNELLFATSAPSHPILPASRPQDCQNGRTLSRGKVNTAVDLKLRARAFFEHRIEWCNE